MRALHRHKVTSVYQPQSADAPLLEALLATKYEDARQELIRLLLLLPQDAREESVRRLCASRKEALRTAGQEICTRLSNK